MAEGSYRCRARPTLLPAHLRSVLAVLLIAGSSFLCCTHLAAFAFSTGSPPSNPRVLVLLDDWSIKASHSSFLNSLQERGYVLDIKLAKDSSLSLQKYGEFLYDTAVLFAPKTTAFGGSVDLASILEFIDSGHDLILAADAGASDVTRDIAMECGVDLDEDPDAVVIDHQSFLKSSADVDHTLILGADVINSTVLLGPSALPGPVVFKGIGLTVSPSSDLVVPVLSASASAYASSPAGVLKEVPALQGKLITLVAATQARNNARVIVSGSLALFSDKFFRIPVQSSSDDPEAAVEASGSSKWITPSGNRQFATELSKWVFHERGHLKAFNLTHHKVGETGEPAVYRISDDLVFSVEIREWTGKEWVPFQAEDVQVQFFMMSPYVLKTLAHDSKGHYSTSFKVPDVYGVFQFKLQYNRLGYSIIDLAKQIPVRPFRHDEFERFIGSAFPYYTSTFSMMLGFFLFGFVFLYHK